MLKKWKKQGVYEKKLPGMLATTRPCSSVFCVEVYRKSTCFYYCLLCF